MIPQIIMTAYLTLVTVYVFSSLYKIYTPVEGDTHVWVVVTTALTIIIPASALYHAGFWAVG